MKTIHTILIELFWASLMLGLLPLIQTANTMARETLGGIFSKLIGGVKS